MSNSRPTRSRVSSPFVGPNATNDPPKVSRESATKSQTSLDKWVEPPLPAPRPSFADAGIARHGVVANMAPLGTRPSSKVMKNARAESADSGRYAPVARRSGLGASAVSSSTASREPELEPEGTVEGTPDSGRLPVANEAPNRRSESIQAEVSEPGEPLTPAQEMESLASPMSPSQEGSTAMLAQPSDSSIVKESAISSVPKSGLSVPSPLQVPSSRTVADLIIAANPPRVHQSPYGPPPAQLSQSPHSQASPVPVFKAGRRDSSHDSLLHVQRSSFSVEKVDRIVESAVTIAVEQRRWPTAYALRTTWDEHRSDARTVKLFDCIYDQRASDEQRREFAALMKSKKKEGKKDKTADYYFNGDGSDAPVLPPLPTSTIKTTSSSFAGFLGPPVFQTPVYKTPYQTPYAAPRPSTPVPPLAPPVNPSGPVQEPNSSSSSLLLPQPPHLNEPITMADDDSRPAKKHKGNDFEASDLNIHKSLNGMSNVTTPEQVPVKERAKSPTSDSSLSSVDETLIDSDDFMGPASPRANSAETPSHARNNRDEPISSPKALGPKTLTFSTATLPSSSSSSLTQPPASSSRATDNPNNEMPSVVAPSSPASQLPFFKPKKDLKRVSGTAYDANDLPSQQKKRAKHVTERSVQVEDSFERGHGTLDHVEDAANGIDLAAQAPVKRPTTVRLLNNGRRYNYDSEAGSSPTNLDFKPDLAPGSRSDSRAATPVGASRPSRKPKSGTGLRVKLSPMKKKGGTAGIPRAGGERSPVGNSTAQQAQTEHDDFCSACGGNGELVCCDGCLRAFHYKCVDPPMIEEALPEDWFCFDCRPQRNDRSSQGQNVFSLLMSRMNAKNPSSFHLTKDIREHFEGVKTGASGEYEESAVPEKPKNRPGYDEAPDYFRLKDSKGNPILCHHCHKSASHPDRMIIPCGFCGLSWHLDCLDPPLAKEPAVAKKWKCPAHVDDLMSATPGNLGPAHRVRKAKGASAITPAFSRGLKNNGYIEVENMASEEEDDGFYEHREYGQVYKLPERGIKLDFISKVKAKCHNGAYNPQFPAPFSASYKPEAAASQVPFDKRSIEEKQAALNLASIASHLPDTSQTLINALIAHAAPNVISLIAQGDATNLESGRLTESDHTALAAMEKLIAQMRSGHNADAKMATPPLDEGNKVNPENKDEDTDMLN
ncbi:phd-finger domain-containing protein [Phlyctema vagabunda]|uniref:Phd-finger domain-containing protein n=1 Tax=Phlyctema vagabunda TaxID=108571 RepID=A0ABR4P768_9HELO